MIVFDRLWITMKKKGISQYKLIKEFGISTGQLDRLHYVVIAVRINVNAAYGLTGKQLMR